MNPETIEVYDGLDSDSVTAALAARQGKILYEMINNIATNDDIDAIFA